MLKGRKRHFSISSSGNWFAHTNVSESETGSRETCRSGFTLSQDETTPQKPREFPLSCHDNKRTLKDNITVFSNGVGRRKYPDNLRQNNSHFHPCDEGANSSTEEPKNNLSTYRTDFTSMGVTDVPNTTRRFPQNHKMRSAEAAKVHAGEKFMWFGRTDLHEQRPTDRSLQSSKMLVWTRNTVFKWTQINTS